MMLSQKEEARPKSSTKSGKGAQQKSFGRELNPGPSHYE
jgi:hypothetical protein